MPLVVTFADAPIDEHLSKRTICHLHKANE